MTGRGKLIAAGVAAFLVFLIAMVPASQLTKRLPQGLALTGVGGTIWSGSASQLKVHGQALGGVRWSCRPWRIFLLEWSCRVTLNPPGGEINGDLTSGLDGVIEGRQLSGQAPISAFEGIATPAGWTGLLELNLERLRIVAGRPAEADGTVFVRALKAPGADGDQLGDFELIIGEGAVGTDTLTGRLRDLGGPLRVRGAIELASDGNYVMSGEVAPGPGAGPSIIDTLAFLGPPDSQGRRPFAIEGSL